MKTIALMIRALWVMIVLVCLPAMVLAAPAKVAILPFEIHAEKDYNYLKKGITQMLASRLSNADEVEIIDAATTAEAAKAAKGLSGDRRALKVGSTLNADYAITGSVTLLGESVSIDAKVHDVTGVRSAMTFFKQTEGMGTVISQINLLANDINSRIFGRETVAAATPPAASAPPAQASPAPASPAPLPASDIHAHPEKLLQEDQSDQPATKPQASPASPLNPAFVQTQGSGDAKSKFWKSRNFRVLINGIDVGDVNGDGVLETILVTPDEIFIYQFTQGRMRLLKQIDAGRFIYNIGVDVADINGNGTPEIFISSLNNQRNVLNSQVIEFDGQAFKQIVSKARWYYRVQTQRDGSSVLLGQRQRTAGADPLSSPVVELAWKGLDYISANQVLPSGKANLLGIAYGDIRNDKTKTLLGFTAEDKLRLFRRSGETMWTSNEHYGGSAVYFLLPGDERGTPERSFFLPTRIRRVDLDGDSNNEIIVPQNVDTANRKLAEQRFYKSATISALSWDGLGMTELWRTKKISGRIQDIAVADFDNDGQQELLAAVVTKEGSIIGTKPQGALIAYDLTTTQAK